MRCHHCGAAIDAGAFACPFCKTQTPHGVEQQRHQAVAARQHAAWTAQETARQTHFRSVELHSLATQILGWGIGAVVLCCFPLGIVGIVQMSRARKLARALGMELPPRAKIGFVISIVSCFTSVGMITTALVSSHLDQEAAEERIASLERRAASKVASPVLDQPTACALAEIHMLQNGWASHPGSSLKQFECVGKVSPRGASDAQLDNLRFRWSATDKYDVNVCFKRGAKWYVTGARKDACPDP